MNKILVTRRYVNIDSIQMFDNLDYYIEYLTSLREKYKEYPVIDIETDVDKDVDYLECSVQNTLRLMSWETDEEYNERMNELEKQKNDRIEFAKELLEKERKEYERLKRKFDGEL